MADTGSAAFAHRLQGRPSLTAEAVCLARALEHVRPEGDRVVDDPWAAEFLSRPTRRALAVWEGSLTGRVMRSLGQTGTTFVPLRHRFIDDHLAAALEAGVTQVVLLGAGYDTRAYRFADRLGGRPVYEVDLAPISRAKAAIIARLDVPDTTMVRVEIDFEREALTDVLPAAGFEVGAPTFFTWEGVSMYLTRAAVTATLDAVWTLGGPGSAIAMDAWHLVDDPSPTGTARRVAPSALSLIGEPITFGLHPEDLTFFLRRRGFEVTDLTMGNDLAERYGSGRSLTDASMFVLAASRLPSQG